ncbi:hypothetical protein JAAARDRAFT_190726 [Jaapia argillacea MUCL 33604]|uniref:Thioredoxin n=1 Tax=Jaapia argillacea MUCL 33604 TaxID=933084 RepID=A0A067Q0R8_9AGAM|nr:hypothetical protein JAAARDRAFT_190726 [Jaapia argillacea MUCL 33604]
MAYLKHLSTTSELDALLEEKKDNLVVIDFHATWCGPCHAIAPIFSKLSESFRAATFAKVDVDRSPQIAQRYAVTAMPTFIFIKNKSVVDQMKGADPKQLESLVRKHASQTAASSSASEVSGDIQVSLLEFLDLSQLNCLNEANDHTLKSIVSTKSKNTSNSFLLSDADEELLLNIPFNQTVRVRSILIHASNPNQGPKKIKILTNRLSLGFEDVEDAEEPEVAQILDLSEEQIIEGKRITLRYVRFQAVNSIHIFVASNQGEEEETRIDAIDVFGVPVETTRDLSGLKKLEE